MQLHALRSSECISKIIVYNTLTHAHLLTATKSLRTVDRFVNRWSSIV